jgi:hypothetical protein
MMAVLHGILGNPIIVGNVVWATSGVVLVLMVIIFSVKLLGIFPIV